jgi:hypothetical protein
METRCEDCHAPIQWPYLRCDNCVRRELAEMMRRRRGQFGGVSRSPEAASTLALTSEDRAFLREMMVGCE